MPDSAFTPNELATLREHGFVILFDRVIFEAQPPMSESAIEAVQSLCSGPLPAQLIALWRETAGGSMDYELKLEMAGNLESLCLTELFYDESSGYHDLQGWIEHEQALAQEAAEDREATWNGQLDYLPIGGFSYLDRVYVTVKPGQEQGHVLAWKQGLPPAWTYRLHEDAVATVGPDLAAAFSALNLPQDPLAPTGEHFTGSSFLEYVADRVERHGLLKELADRLIAFYRLAIVDWRSRVSDGSIAGHASHALIAMDHAIVSDDAHLVTQLASLEVRLDSPIAGSALPVEYAVGRGSFNAAHALLMAGSPVRAGSMSELPSEKPVPVDLVSLLLERGAEPDASVVVECVENGSIESADTIARHLAARDPKFGRKLNEARQSRIQKLRSDLKQVRAGKLSHYLSEEQLKQHIEIVLAYAGP